MLHYIWVLNLKPNVMNSNFFSSNSYFIDEKVNFLNFENSYKIFDDQGQIIGSVCQKLSTPDKILRVLVNKAMLPFMLEIRNKDGKLESTISRGWTFLTSKITIKDAQGMQIGILKQKFRLLKQCFTILDDSERKVAEITGDWKSWNFVIKDTNDTQIGLVTKKWAGAMKEIFTTADKYLVEIDPAYSNNKGKIIILSCAITIDMVLKESK